LLVPAPEDLFEAYEISPAVNRVANDYPGLIEPVRKSAAPVEDGAVASPAAAPPKRSRKPKKDDRQSSLF